MKWSTRITYGKYLTATLRSTSPVAYIVFVGFVVFVVAFDGGANELLYWVIGFLEGIIGVVLLVMAFVLARLRRMRRLAGTDIMDYELTKDTLWLRAGGDAISLPLRNFKLRYEGDHFLGLKRNKTLAGVVVLMFDNGATRSKAKDYISKNTSQRAEAAADR